MRPLARILEALQKIGYAHVIQHHLTQKKCAHWSPQRQGEKALKSHYSGLTGTAA